MNEFSCGVMAQGEARALSDEFSGAARRRLGEMGRRESGRWAEGERTSGMQRKARRQGDASVAECDSNLSSDLKQLQLDGRHFGARQFHTLGVRCGRVRSSECRLSPRRRAKLGVAETSKIALRNSSGCLPIVSAQRDTNGTDRLAWSRPPAD